MWGLFCASTKRKTKERFCSLLIASALIIRDNFVPQFLAIGSTFVDEKTSEYRVKHRQRYFDRDVIRGDEISRHLKIRVLDAGMNLSRHIHSANQSSAKLVLVVMSIIISKNFLAKLLNLRSTFGVFFESRIRNLVESEDLNARRQRLRPVVRNDAVNAGQGDVDNFFSLRHDRRKYFETY